MEIPESMEFFYKSLVALSVRAFNDVLPRNLDAIYLVAETADNQDSVLNVGSELFLTGVVRKISISGADAGHGYPGY